MRRTHRSKGGRHAIPKSLIALVIALIGVPALAGETFVDIDSSVHRGSIEAVAKEGITKGCDAQRFCPDEPVTRGQMAAFLVRSFGFESGSTTTAFKDVADSIFERDIEVIASHGLTRGCNPPANDRYCPNKAVSRGEMATFLTRSLDLPVPSSVKTFSDISHSPHRLNIEALAKAGITTGCNPPENDRFCSDEPVSRAQMATFLVRALGLETIDHGGDHDGGSERDWSVEVDIPVDAIHLQPGDSLQQAVNNASEGETFVLAPGVYRGQEIVPKKGQTFVGEPGAKLEGNGKAYAFLAQKPNVTVAGLEITGYSPPSRKAVIQSSGMKGWRVIGNIVHHNQEIGVKFSAEWLVADNHIHHNSRFGLVGSGAGVTVVDNEISYNRTDTSLPIGNSSGTKFVRTTNLIVRDNSIHHNNGNGLWVDINNLDPLIEGNDVYANERGGIFIEISCGGVIRDNVVKENGVGAPYPSWIGDGTGILVANSPNVQVYGNTLIGNGKGVGGIHWDHPNLGAVDKCTPELKNLRVFDNDVKQSSGPVAGIDAKVDKGAVWSSWGNRFYGNTYDVSGSAQFRWEGGWLSVNQWLSQVEGN